jgi:RHS repeat-associated protein
MQTDFIYDCTSSFACLYGSKASRYTGKERDTESGLDYFGARYYASNMGRWMSPDPLQWVQWQNGNRSAQEKFSAYIADPQHLNLYAYVGNNPLSRTDPTGLYECKGSADQCAMVKSAVEAIAKAASNSSLSADQQKALGAVSQFLGSDTDKNGVVIAVGDAHGNQGEASTSGGITTLAVSFKNMDGKVFAATADRAGLIAHEGTHGMDQRAGGMARNRSEEMSTERNAYGNQSSVYQGLGVEDIWWRTWAPGMTDAQRQGAIDHAAQGSTDKWCSEWDGCK